MIGTHARTTTRPAFTLVELMVVILIIAILVSLLLAAVNMVLGKIPETTTRTEISQFEISLNGFMTDYHLSYPPPSALLLDEQLQYAPGDATYKFLQQAFGKNLGAGTQAINPNKNGLPWIDWNGDNLANGPKYPNGGGNVYDPWYLEGEQCLVFYLGGINNNGFSANNMDPAHGTVRRGPYYQFETGRLIPGNTWNATVISGNPSSLSGFLVYLDPWKVKNPGSVPAGGLPAVSHALGTPYAYFSTYGINNVYYASHCANLYPAGYGAGNALGYTPAAPYTSTSGYMNSNTFQIISAGKDGVFGSGAWIPASGATGNGFDDQANFSSKLLGAGQQ